MLLYGKELLYNGKIYDFEERIKRISSVKLSDVYNAIDINFSEVGRASALVGKVDEPLKL